MNKKFLFLAVAIQVQNSLPMQSISIVELLKKSPILKQTYWWPSKQQVFKYKEKQDQLSSKIFNKRNDYIEFCRYQKRAFKQKENRRNEKLAKLNKEIASIVEQKNNLFLKYGQWKDVFEEIMIPSHGLIENENSIRALKEEIFTVSSNLSIEVNQVEPYNYILIKDNISSRYVVINTNFSRIIALAAIGNGLLIETLKPATDLGLKNKCLKSLKVLQLPLDIKDLRIHKSADYEVSQKEVDEINEYEYLD